MMDVKTIDEMTEFTFKDEQSKQRWMELVTTQYFENQKMRVLMDFTRRWGKIMQYKITGNKNVTLCSVIISSAKEADLNSVITREQLNEAINLISDIWVYGIKFKDFMNNGGLSTIEKNF